MADDQRTLESVDRRLDELTDLFQRRLLEDRDKRRMLDELHTQLETLRAAAAGEMVLPLVRELFLLVDRLDSYAGPDSDFAASVTAELLEALRRQGVEEVPTDGELDPAWHEVADGVMDAAAEPRIAAVRRRGYVRNGRVLRPARVDAGGVGAAPAGGGEQQP